MSVSEQMLFNSPEPVVHGHDLVMFDLDGVLYRGIDAIDGVAEQVRAIRAAVLAVAYVTNNASRSSHAIGEHLRSLGVEARDEEVTTSASAVARMIAEQWAPGSRVAVLGAPELAAQLRHHQLIPTTVEDPAADAVVSGFGPEVVWEEILRASVRVREGLPWYASNTDLTYPAGFGLAPGHGALVRLIEEFAGVSPQVAGKPAPALLEDAMARVAAQRPLMVGDRPDTDIAGARKAGIPSFLVMTGVCDLEMLVGCRPYERPDHLGATLAALVHPSTGTRRVGDTWINDHWTAWIESGELRTAPTPSADPGDRAFADRRWQAIAAAAWEHADRTGDVATQAG